MTESTQPESRSSILARFRGHDRAARADRRRRRRHRSVGQVRGGRWDRPDRHLQLRSIPDGRPRFTGGPAGVRERQRDRGRDGTRGATGRRAHSGAGRGQRHRSVLPPRGLPARAAPARVRRRAELPDRRPDRRGVPPEPRGDRHGLRPRGRDDPSRGVARHAHDALRVQRATTRWP